MFVWWVTEGSSKDWLPQKLGECRVPRISSLGGSHLEGPQMVQRKQEQLVRAWGPGAECGAEGNN